MAQQRKDAVAGVVHAAPAPAPKAAGVPELHHVSEEPGPSLQGARMLPPRIEYLIFLCTLDHGISGP